MGRPTEGIAFTQETAICFPGYCMFIIVGVTMKVTEADTIRRMSDCKLGVRPKPHLKSVSLIDLCLTRPVPTLTGPRAPPCTR